MKKSLILLLLSISIAAKAQKPTEKQAILNVLAQQRTDWNKGNLEGYMQGYLKSDLLLFVSKSGPNYGWQKTFEGYQKFYPDKASMGYLTFDIKQIKMIDKTHAFVLGAWNIKTEKDNSKGFFTLIVQKFRDGWKVIVDHTS